MTKISNSFAVRLAALAALAALSMLRRKILSIVLALITMQFVAGCGESADTDPKNFSENLTAALAQTQYMPNLQALRADLASGAVTSEDMVAIYLQRIALIDKNGPELRSVIAINPDAIEQARNSDKRRGANIQLSPLDGIPVLIKDNIETRDPLPTTAGSSALLNNYSQDDSAVVARLRAAGAVILGKANLSQWANFRSSNSISGWSAVGGQVKNPHVLDRSPCGSSSGSGAAVAAGLTTLALGTETNGSIICPAHVNGVVGFKPTVGLLPTQGIIPISASQDTAGPMTKTVTGAIEMMNVLTASNRFSGIEAKPLNQIRIGVLRFAEGNNPHISRVFNESLTKIEQAGASLVDIYEFQLSDSNYWANELATLEIEFAQSITQFLEERAERLPVSSLNSLILFNRDHAEVELALFGQEHFISSAERPEAGSQEHIRALKAIQLASGQHGIDKLLKEANVDLLTAPSGPMSPPVDLINGDIWPTWVGAGYLAAIAGYPHLTIPMGEVRGLPLGLSIMGAADQDALVLSTGREIEAALQSAPFPAFLVSASSHSEIQTAVKGMQ